VLYNYLSSGDEVFEIAPTSDITAFSGFVWDWFLGVIPTVENPRRFAWQKQALFKGRSSIYGTTWAGWGFSYDDDSPPQRVYTRTQANAATEIELQTKPVFRRNPGSMFNSSIAPEMRNEILARGIPELAPTIGGVYLESLLEERNRNMQTLQRDDGAWPQRAVDFSDNNTKPKRWLHTDLMNAAHYFTHKLYKELVTKGDMQ
jgi:hypothetical protein